MLPALGAETEPPRLRPTGNCTARPLAPTQGCSAPVDKSLEPISMPRGLISRRYRRRACAPASAVRVAGAEHHRAQAHLVAVACSRVSGLRVRTIRAGEKVAAST